MIPRTMHHISAIDLADKGAEYDSSEDHHERTTAVPEQDANTISSRIVDAAGTWAIPMHAPVLDIDFPIFAIPSSTPGHFHLYIERLLDWDQYEKVLRVLGEVGIIEEGYARACIERSASYVRKPTCTKPTCTKPLPDLPPDVEPF